MINRYPPWSCRCLTVACRHSAVPRPLGRCILHMILFSFNLWRAMSSLSPVLYRHNKWNCPSSHVDPALSCSCRAGGCHDTVAWYKTQRKSYIIYSYHHWHVIYYVLFSWWSGTPLTGEPYPFSMTVFPKWIILRISSLSAYAHNLFHIVRP